MNLTATTFDLDNACLCAALAGAAYGDDKQIIPGALSIKLITGKETDTQVLVVEFPEYISVNFRGTSNLKDAFTDIQIKRVRFLNSADELHSGVNAAVNEIFFELRE